MNRWALIYIRDNNTSEQRTGQHRSEVNKNGRSVEDYKGGCQTTRKNFGAQEGRTDACPIKHDVPRLTIIQAPEERDGASDNNSHQPIDVVNVHVCEHMIVCGCSPEMLVR
jgi:hypothetical protein